MCYLQNIPLNHSTHSFHARLCPARLIRNDLFDYSRMYCGLMWSHASISNQITNAVGASGSLGPARMSLAGSLPKPTQFLI